MPEQTAKMITLFSQEDVNYVPVSTANGKACSACRFYCDEACHIVYGEIAPNGYCDRYETVPPPPPAPDVAPIPVMIVEAPEMDMGEMSLKAEDGVFNRIMKRIQDAVNPAQPETAFTVQKDLNGEWRWIATFTNNFLDRTKEIISEEALDNYLERVNAKLVPMPDLRVGHVPESVHGRADMIFGTGNFVTAVGHFDDTPEALKAIEYYRKHASKLSLSHGFTYPGWAFKDGVYESINTFEISVLPPPLVAANPFTEFEVENMKQITPEQKVALAAAFGAEKADAIVKSREQQSEEIKAAGVAFKDFVELKDGEAPAETPSADALKPMGELIADLIESQGELLTVLTAQGKALKAYQDAQTVKETEAATALAAVVSTTEKLQAELKLTPRAASSAVETKLSADDAKEFKQQLESTEADPFFQI